jgi:RNA-directed DNA polymerase
MAASDRRPSGQGAVISSLRPNGYLHYAFDLWAEQWRGREVNADDLVLGFEHEADAKRFHVRFCAGGRDATGRSDEGA